LGTPPPVGTFPLSRRRALALSSWIVQNIRLPKGVSALPGAVRCEAEEDFPSCDRCTTRLCDVPRA